MCKQVDTGEVIRNKEHTGVVNNKNKLKIKLVFTCECSCYLDLKGIYLSYTITLLFLPSLVAWFAVNITVLPRTPGALYKLYFS